MYLTDDKKFLTGNSVSIYDMQVAGWLTNLIKNPSARDAPAWAAAWENTPDRVKKYYEDFAEEMKDYLDARPKGCP